MPKTITFTADIYPYCLGDVVTLSDDELKNVDTIAKARKLKAYVVGAQAEVESSAEADRQAEAVAAAEGTVVDEKVAQASVDLDQAAAATADEHSVNSPSGRTTAGSAAGRKVQTAAAHAGDDKDEASNSKADKK